MSFKIGDVCRLNSGGPKMVVIATRASENGHAALTCAWCVRHDDVMRESTFDERCVRRELTTGAEREP